MISFIPIPPLSKRLLGNTFVSICKKPEMESHFLFQVSFILLRGCQLRGCCFNRQYYTTLDGSCCQSVKTKACTTSQCRGPLETHTTGIVQTNILLINCEEGFSPNLSTIPWRWPADTPGEINCNESPLWVFICPVLGTPLPEWPLLPLSVWPLLAQAAAPSASLSSHLHVSSFWLCHPSVVMDHHGDCPPNLYPLAGVKGSEVFGANVRAAEVEQVTLDMSYLSAQRILDDFMHQLTIPEEEDGRRLDCDGGDCNL